VTVSLESYQPSGLEWEGNQNREGWYTMISFSQKKGLKPIRAIMQSDDMDQDLRVALWNILNIYYWDHFRAEFDRGHSTDEQEEAITLCKILWMWHFNLPVDTMPYEWHDLYIEIRAKYLAFSWNEVYDFIEYVAAVFKLNYPNNQVNSNFIAACNNILKKELSAYRIVGDIIVQITSEEEITEIEGILTSKKLGLVQEHIQTALKHLSNRKDPDYRNSIKESISAVEALCIKISQKPKAELADALKTIESKLKIHSALRIAFDKLYAYTSDAEGIRHALLNEGTLDFEDAKFMLVACSAFINYIVIKVEKAGIKIELG
jgi:hypothetical protein